MRDWTIGRNGALKHLLPRYMDYVAKIKENPIARAVKLSDLAHNMELGRPENVTDADLERIEKCKAAKSLLSSD